MIRDVHKSLNSDGSGKIQKKINAMNTRSHEEIFILGISHHTAGVEIREQMAFGGEKITSALEKLQALPEIHESVILSTCNRTELYVTTDHCNPQFFLYQFWCEEKKSSLAPENLYFYQGEEALLHLFRVTSGLDSLMLGETQVLGQVKDAWHLAKEKNTVSSLLNRAFKRAIRAGKKVHSDTRFSQGAISVAYAGVELANKIFQELDRHAVLLLGAGKTGTLVAEHLKDRGVEELYIANRTRSKAEDLAQKLGGKALSFLEFDEVFPKVDIIVGATASPEYLIKREDTSQLLSHQSYQPLLLIDLGIPRNFDPGLGKYDNIFLHHVDDLERIVAKNLEKRKTQIPRVEKLLREEVERYMSWRDKLKVTPTIIALRDKIEGLRQREMDFIRNQLDPAEVEKMEKLTHRLVNKILHAPLKGIKKYATQGKEGLLRVEVLRQLFDLEEDLED